MTGIEHYQEAERLLRDKDGPRPRVKPWPVTVAEAQVHATLALAAATALSTYHTSGGLPEADHQGWYAAASEGPGVKARHKAAETAELTEQAGE
jgi:hypothetical protein